MVIGMYGTIPFLCSEGRVLTFKSFTREHAAKWAKHEVLGGRPALEYVGESLPEASLDIRLDSGLGVIPTVAITLLRVMVKDPSARALIIGGEYLGRYVLESFSESRKFFNGAGACTVADVSIKLTEFEAGLF
jgi:phage protein U